MQQWSGVGVFRAESMLALGVRLEVRTMAGDVSAILRIDDTCGGR